MRERGTVSLCAVLALFLFLSTTRFITITLPWKGETKESQHKESIIGCGTRVREMNGTCVSFSSLIIM